MRADDVDKITQTIIRAITASPTRSEKGQGKQGTYLVERSHDRGGVRDARGLEQDAVEGVAPLEKFEQGLDQVTPDSAAHAPIVHGDDVLRLPPERQRQ